MLILELYLLEKNRSQTRVLAIRTQRDSQVAGHMSTICSMKHTMLIWMILTWCKANRIKQTGRKGKVERKLINWWIFAACDQFVAMTASRDSALKHLKPRSRSSKLPHPRTIGLDHALPFHIMLCYTTNKYRVNSPFSPR